MARPIVLAAVDLRAMTRRVLFHAAGFARLMNADLKIVHVGKLDGEAEAIDQCLAMTPYEAPIEEDDVLLRSGRVSEMIQREAQKLGACLIVIGSRGRSELARFLVGSSGEALLKSARTPVLIVPPHDFDIVSLGDRALLTCGPVLAPVSLASHNEVQLRIGADLAMLAARPLVLMTVAPSRVSDEDAAMELRSRTWEMPVQLQTSVVVRRGNVADELARCVRAEEVGLAVMGLRQHRRIRPGIAADAVLRTGRAFGTGGARSRGVRRLLLARRKIPQRRGEFRTRRRRVGCSWRVWRHSRWHARCTSDRRQRTLMHPTPVELNFTDANGCKRLLTAVTIDGREWHLHASLDGHVFSHHCSDWQRVERILRWLKAHAHEPSVRRDPGAPRALATAAAAVVFLLAMASSGSAQVVVTEEQAVLQFQQNVDQYVLLHRQVKWRLPTLEVNANPDTILSAIDAMAGAMRAARPDAQQGDLFTPDSQDALRSRLARAMRYHATHEPGDVHADDRLEFGDVPPEPLKVNDTFPWKVGMPAYGCLLQALPRLPSELMYRFVGNDLILIDVHAGVVVDILPRALQETTFN